MNAMRDAVALPVTVKHRIGLDANEDYGLVRDSTEAPRGAAAGSTRPAGAWSLRSPIVLAHM